jgi:hypothetical protein
MSKIGTGEGAQAYGHGLYFAESEPVAKQYRDVLSSRAGTDTPEGSAKFWGNMYGRDGAVRHLEGVIKATEKYPRNYEAGAAESAQKAIDYLKSGGDLSPNAGHMYEVNINADPAHFLDWDKPLSQQSRQTQDAVRAAYEKKSGFQNVAPYASGQDISKLLGDKAASAQALSEAGIPGIKYLDQGSRSAGEGSRNYVVFNDKLIDIVKKYGLAGLLGSGILATDRNRQ